MLHVSSFILGRFLVASPSSPENREEIAKRNRGLAGATLSNVHFAQARMPQILAEKRAASDLGAQSTPSESENLMSELHPATEIPRPHIFPEKKPMISSHVGSPWNAAPHFSA